MKKIRNTPKDVVDNYIYDILFFRFIEKVINIMNDLEKFQFETLKKVVLDNGSEIDRIVLEFNLSQEQLKKVEDVCSKHQNANREQYSSIIEEFSKELDLDSKISASLISRYSKAKKYLGLVFVSSR